jgi:hypothetical protein
MKHRLSVIGLYWTISYAIIQFVVVVAASLAETMTWPLFAAFAGIEGVLLGLAQGRLLRDFAPRLTLQWTLATVVGVLASRFIEFSIILSPLTALLQASPAPLRFLSDVVIGFVMGAALGAVQAIPLRQTVPHPYRWVAVCGAAYAFGLSSLFLAGLATDKVAQVMSLRAAMTVFSLFAASFLLTGAIEGYGLAWTFSGVTRKRGDTHA